ncbi:regulatory protein RecX [Tepiditoga spiralis]|nr:regulatory protein RecX [Tepiditoga spiralis]
MKKKKPKKIFDPSDIKAAEKSAEYLIRYRMRSEKELLWKLKEKGFSDEIILELIEKLKKYKLINDKIFAYHFAYDKLTLSKKGPLIIQMELRKLGVDEYLIQDTLIQLKNEINIYEIAFELGKKYYEKNNDLIKTKNFLYKKGFEQSTINYVIADIQ